MDPRHLRKLIDSLPKREPPVRRARENDVTPNVWQPWADANRGVLDVEGRDTDGVPIPAEWFRPRPRLTRYQEIERLQREQRTGRTITVNVVANRPHPTTDEVTLRDILERSGRLDRLQRDLARVMDAEAERHGRGSRNGAGD